MTIQNLKNSKMTKNIFCLALVFFVTVCIPEKTFASFIFSEKYGYALDLPEGYFLSAQDKDTSYYFETKLMPVNLALKLISSEDAKSAENALSSSLEKLNASKDISSFQWIKNDASVASFTFSMNGTENKGWACSAFIPSSKYYIVLLCYADGQIEFDCDQFIFSTLDSLFNCDESFVNPGIFTSFAFPKTKDENFTVEIANKKINLQLDQDDSVASEFVIEREIAVLSLYGNSSNKTEAWKRYYRMIFRDSAERLKVSAENIYKVLYPEAQKLNSENPNSAYVQLLLTWVQNMPLGATLQYSNLTPLPSILKCLPSDCDGRSLLMCLILEHSGIDTTLFVSEEYKHAVLGAAVLVDGAKIRVGDVDYVLGETTAKVNFGLIASTQSDSSKWIAIPLP